MGITMNDDYDIIEIEKDNINLIKDLWEKNRIFHQNKTSNFSYQYSNLNFDERMNNVFNSKNIKYYKISAIINKNNRILFIYNSRKFGRVMYIIC